MRKERQKDLIISYFSVSYVLFRRETEGKEAERESGSTKAPSPIAASNAQLETMTSSLQH